MSRLPDCQGSAGAPALLGRRWEVPVPISAGVLGVVGIGPRCGCFERNTDPWIGYAAISGSKWTTASATWLWSLFFGWPRGSTRTVVGRPCCLGQRPVAIHILEWVCFGAVALLCREPLAESLYPGGCWQWLCINKSNA